MKTRRILIEAKISTIDIEKNLIAGEELGPRIAYLDKLVKKGMLYKHVNANQTLYTNTFVALYNEGSQDPELRSVIDEQGLNKGKIKKYEAEIDADVFTEYPALTIEVTTDSGSITVVLHMKKKFWRKKVFIIANDAKLNPMLNEVIV